MRSTPDLNGSRHLGRLDRCGDVCYRSALSGRTSMAKQRRAKSRFGRAKQGGASNAPNPRPVERRREPEVANGPVAVPTSSPGHLEAVALYEEGVAAIQAHEFSRASALLRSVVTRFPEERELARAGPPVPQCLRTPYDPAGRITFYAGGTCLRSHPGGKRRKLRRGTRALASRQRGIAGTRPRALYAGLCPGVAPCLGRSRSFAPACH